MDVPATVVAIFFALMGAVTLVRPAAAWKPFGIAPTTAAARNEVRAVYGGFGLAVAGLILLTDQSQQGFRNGVLVAVAVLCAGMAGGRIIGFVIEPRAARAFPLVFLLVEVVLGLLAWVATA
jgi:hypothetical protein